MNLALAWIKCAWVGEPRLNFFLTEKSLMFALVLVPEIVVHRMCPQAPIHASLPHFYAVRSVRLTARKVARTVYV